MQNNNLHEPIPTDESGKFYQNRVNKKNETLSQLQTIGYSYIHDLGVGSFGQVIKMVNSFGHHVAVKIVPQKIVSKYEIEIWPHLNHPNILPLIQHFYLNIPDVTIFITPIHPGTLQGIVKTRDLTIPGALNVIKKFLYDILTHIRVTKVTQLY